MLQRCRLGPHAAHDEPMGTCPNAEFRPVPLTKCRLIVIGCSERLAPRLEHAPASIGRTGMVFETHGPRASSNGEPEQVQRNVARAVSQKLPCHLKPKRLKSGPRPARESPNSSSARSSRRHAGLSRQVVRIMFLTEIGEEFISVLGVQGSGVTTSWRASASCSCGVPT